MSRGRVRLPILGGGSLELRPSKIIAVGLNYADHVQESPTYSARGHLEMPQRPVLFAKTPNVLIGPGQPIVLSRLPREEGIAEPRTDYEAELALILGRGGKRFSRAEAEMAVAFYTCFNDVTQRDIQKADPSGWFRGKSLDTFGPIGPVLVPFERLGPDPKLRIQAILNGHVVQDSSTGQMLFPPTELLQYISRCFTLEEGDIVVTGTPSGVGPLHPGDRIEVWIEGIGTLANPVVDEEP